MILSQNTEKLSSTESFGTHIQIPPDASIPNPPPKPTLFDYFALLPLLITAATPLILGLRKNRKKSSDSDKEES